MAWQMREREVKSEIMHTDVFVQVFSETQDEQTMEVDIDQAFVMFRGFASRFSRFREESELSVLNRASEMRVSEELFTLLLHSRQYFEETGGVFDPTILPTLEREGYGASFGSVLFGEPGVVIPERHYTFADVTLDVASRTVSKPLDCRLDLGGIGKGYIVDQVAQRLAERYTDFLVDAGGDMYIAGRNRAATYPYFAIDIESAFEEGQSAGMLLVSNQAVATSGVNRRRWRQRDGREKSHLIDTKHQHSVVGDILTATVIASSTERADVLAKTLCLLGQERGLVFATEKRIPVFLLLKDGTINRNDLMKPFLWESFSRGEE